MNKLGKFEVIEKVGQGAMGVVYKARDPFIDRIVALKTLTTGLAEDPNLLKRFYSEAKSAGGLQHPNIVTIYELGHEGSMPYIAMQFLSGESLDKMLHRRVPLTLAQKVGFIVYVCRALEYAHKQNPPVIHRDIKPGNVMITTDGAVVVVDFGIARLGEGTRSHSAGLLIGTLGYMAPQLFRNSAADARSDVWATGVMFYELLAGRRPFEGDNAAALMSAIILDKHRPLSETEEGRRTPPDIQAVVDRMLAKEAEARYQSMEEVSLELEPIWQRLRQAEVVTLLSDGQKLFEEGKLKEAKDKIGHVIQIDTSNTVAKSLLEKINAESKRKQIVPQLKERVEKAEQLLANGQIENAKVLIQEALRLDSAYLPAREFLAHLETAEERLRNIAQGLRTCKQRIAEGALTEAELQLDKVLELDPGNEAASKLQREIKEERSRRERRKQRDLSLHNARALWTNLRYDECIQVLREALKQFPGDTELSKLLESAQQDQAEQRRQALVGEVRTFLNKQEFDEALRALDSMAEQYPADPTLKKLRTHALEGREQRAQEERLAQVKSELRTWVKQGKYEDVLKNANQLSRDFSGDFELKELFDFARAEMTQVAQKNRLEESIKQIQQALKEGRFSQAVEEADRALREFPKNIDLIILQDRAKKEKAEKEKQDLLKQRLRDVERLIGRQQITDAIDLARQTLATVGQDPRIADTLRKAEKELELREAQRKEKEKEAKKEPPAARATRSGAVTDPNLPTSTLPQPDPGNDYVYQRGAPIGPDSAPPETNVTPFSATFVTPAPSPSPHATGRTEPRGASSDLFAPLPDTKQERAVEKRRPQPEIVREVVEPGPEVITRPLWKNKMILAGMAVVLVSAWVALSLWKPPHKTVPQTHGQQTEQETKTSPGDTPSETKTPPQETAPQGTPPAVEQPGTASPSAEVLYGNAQDFYSRKDWPRAKSAFEQVIHAQDVSGDLRNRAQQRMGEVQKHLDEQSLMRDANQALNRNDRATAKTLYQRVVDMSLEHATDARLMIQKIDAGDLAELTRGQIDTLISQHDYAASREKLQEWVIRGGQDSNNAIAQRIEDAESQWFESLQQQLGRAKAASDVNQLQALRGDFEKVANGHGRNAPQAQRIAVSEIPNLVSEIKTRIDWLQLKSDCDNALNRNDTTLMNSVKNRLTPFMNGSYAGEARNCGDRISAALKPPPPPPPPANNPVSPAKVDPSEAINAINATIANFAKALNEGNVAELKKVCHDKGLVDAVEGLAGNGLKYEIHIAPNPEIKTSPDGPAQVNAKITGKYPNGKLRPNLQLKVAKLGTNWTITEVRFTE